MAHDIIPTNYMITKVARIYGVTSKQALKMRWYVLQYKTTNTVSYNDCLKVYKKIIGEEK